MPKEILKCRCKPGYQCSTHLHGTIEIISCKKNCGLGCANDSGKRRKKSK